MVRTWLHNDFKLLEHRSKGLGVIPEHSLVFIHTAGHAHDGICLIYDTETRNPFKQTSQATQGSCEELCNIPTSYVVLFRGKVFKVIRSLQSTCQHHDKNLEQLIYCL